MSRKRKRKKWHVESGKEGINPSVQRSGKLSICNDLTGDVISGQEKGKGDAL
jgi:hypothetical protein